MKSNFPSSNGQYRATDAPGLHKKRRLGVLLGDVRSSRLIDTRDVFSKKINEACDSVNARFNNQLFAGFKVLKGLDEIGGVLHGIAPVYEIISMISEELYPVSMNFTFVYNYVDTALETGDTALMDGPAFHKAAGEMKNLKKSRLMFYMECQNELIDSAITGEINLLSLIKEHWSARQHRIVRQYKKVKSQKEVAKQLGVTPQAISQTLRSIAWKEIDVIEQKINANLEQYEAMIT